MGGQRDPRGTRLSGLRGDGPVSRVTLADRPVRTAVEPIMDYGAESPPYTPSLLG